MGGKHPCTGKTFEEAYGVEKAKEIKKNISATTTKSMMKYKKSYKYKCDYCKKIFFRNVKHKHSGKFTFCSRKCYYKWLKGNHNMPDRTGATLSAAHKKILVDTVKANWKNPEYRRKVLSKNLLMNPETHPLRLMAKKRLAQGLTRGYISNQQEKLFVIIKNKFKNHNVDMEHPVKYENRHFYLDIAIPSIKLDIEYDGEYWHKDKEKDAIRDQKLKSLGWNIIRINKNNIQNVDEIVKGYI